MLMYVDTKVVFAEVPDEVTLAINISNCPCNCKGCHSPYLGTNTGEPLFPEVLDELIDNNKGITCVAIMGGDSNPAEVDALAFYIKAIYDNIKVAWYSGRQELSGSIKLKNFDYIKLGPYKEECGPLSSKTTNQRFYKVEGNTLTDITEKFWK